MRLRIKFLTVKTVVRHLFNEFSREAKRGRLHCVVNRPETRVVKVMSKFVSKRTIRKYINEDDDQIENGQEISTRREKIDSFDKDAIKRMLIDMFQNRDLVTIRIEPPST